MNISVQVENLKLLKKAVESDCMDVRYGSEFCEYKVPSLENLKEAYEIVKGRGKRFSYVTPHLSSDGIDKIKKQLNFLNKKNDVSIIINDFGTLDIIDDYPELIPHLGRQLVRVPARSPWIDRMITETDLLAVSSTSLNYPLTLKLFQSKGIRKVDFDWLPLIFSSFENFVKSGLKLFIHLYLVPVTITRKCHTARFIGEKGMKRCFKECYDKAFFIKQRLLNLDFYIYGNAVFRFLEPYKEELKDLAKIGVNELVIPMNSITGVDNKEKINKLSYSIIEKVNN